MPTLAQLQQEVWWGRETIPPALATLRSRLLSFWGIPSGNIGVKGNTAHLAGYHRSFAWVRNSSWSTSNTYSTSETPGNRHPGNENWLAALDISLPNNLLLPMCQRVDQAVRSGTLEKVTEWYGNRDGDSRVDGYDNIHNRVASSDSSHLWHLHLSFDRGRVNEDHDDLYEVLTGEGMEPTDVWAYNITSPSLDRAATARDWIKDGYGAKLNTEKLITAVAELKALLEALPTSGGGGGGVSEDRIRQIVREELDVTRLAK